MYLGSSYYYSNYVFENRFHVGGDFYSNVGIYAKNGLDIEGSFYCSEAIKYAKYLIKEEHEGGYENEDRNFFEWLVYMNRKKRL